MSMVGDRRGTRPTTPVTCGVICSTRRCRVVATDGPSAVNLRALARDIGVSHAAPANHFADKTAVFTAIAQEGFELLGQAMAAAADAVPAGRAGLRVV